MSSSDADACDETILNRVGARNRCGQRQAGGAGDKMAAVKRHDSSPAGVIGCALFARFISNVAAAGNGRSATFRRMRVPFRRTYTEIVQSFANYSRAFANYSRAAPVTRYC